jgi:hypothetical protein
MTLRLVLRNSGVARTKVGKPSCLAAYLRRCMQISFIALHLRAQNSGEAWANGGRLFDFVKAICVHRRK